MQKNLSLIWQKIAEILEPNISVDTYKRWFAAVQLIGASDECLTLKVPNHIYQLWIESNYLSVLQSAITAALGITPKISFVHAEEEAAGSSEKEKRELISEKKQEEHKPKLHKERQEPIPRTAVSSVSDQVASVNVPGLNPRNIFESYVVGSNNQFAHAACLAVAKAPARTYNPLFIYGGTGLGKTHLMHAIGYFVTGAKKNAKIVYLTSEQFTNEFIDAIQNGSLVKFRKRYRQADVFMIDDIQFFAGKERSQEEFFHTFNTLFDGHKQIVLSSDRPASEISNLEQRLVSRFEWGLTAELQPPDMETRMAILRKKAELMKVPLEPGVFEFLADRIRSNVRRLEGALMRVASYASLSGGELNRESIEHLLKDILQEEARQAITIDQIQRHVADHFDIRLADMTSKRRPKNIAFPRQVAMYLSRELTPASLSDIGDAFGGRDHGTVLHAHRLIKSKIDSDEKIRQVINLLDEQLQR